MGKREKGIARAVNKLTKEDVINRAVEKLDGSTLIVSKYKGQYILRTRGTVDASTYLQGAKVRLSGFTVTAGNNPYNGEYTVASIVNRTFT